MPAPSKEVQEFIDKIWTVRKERASQLKGSLGQGGSLEKLYGWVLESFCEEFDLQEEKRGVQYNKNLKMSDVAGSLTAQDMIREVRTDLRGLPQTFASDVDVLHQEVKKYVEGNLGKLNLEGRMRFQVGLICSILKSHLTIHSLGEMARPCLDPTAWCSKHHMERPPSRQGGSRKRRTRSTRLRCTRDLDRR